VVQAAAAYKQGAVVSHVPVALLFVLGAAGLAGVDFPWPILGTIPLVLVASALLFVKTASRKQLKLVMLFN
jgi:hypothetical protein